MSLEVQDVTKRFGGLVAVDGVSLDVPSGGSIIGLMGPNGAGKTTLFNCITGYLRPERGEVRLDGAAVTAMKPYRRAQLGIGRTFQRLAVFDTMTVEENVQVAVEARLKGGLVRNLFGLRHRTDPSVAAQTDAIVSTMRLDAVRDEVVGGLSTGFGRLVELGRALATSPAYVLLDEPASGLDTNETRFLEAVLRDVVASGVSLLLVEHDVDLVLRLCSEIHVLDFGSKIAEGTPEEIRTDPAVRAAYLGEEVGAGA